MPKLIVTDREGAPHELDGPAGLDVVGREDAVRGEDLAALDLHLEVGAVRELDVELASLG